MLYRRTSRFAPDAAEIPLSPLIDCVFLLLIFFLVTTMLKRKETIIPVVLPDATSSLSAEAAEEVLVLGLAEDGGFLAPAERNRFGALDYEPGGSLDDHLDALIASGGPEILDRALRLDVEPDTPFQKTIDAIDTLKLRGFAHVGVKILDPYGE